MNMDLDAATKEAPTLTLDPFAEAKAEIVEKKPEELVEEQAVPEMELTPEEHKKWKQIDDEILDSELKEMFSGEAERIPVPLRSTPDFSERPHGEVEEEFIRIAEELLN